MYIKCIYSKKYFYLSEKEKKILSDLISLMNIDMQLISSISIDSIDCSYIGNKIYHKLINNEFKEKNGRITFDKENSAPLNIKKNILINQFSIFLSNAKAGIEIE